MVECNVVVFSVVVCLVVNLLEIVIFAASMAIKHLIVLNVSNSKASLMMDLTNPKMCNLRMCWKVIVVLVVQTLFRRWQL